MSRFFFLFVFTDEREKKERSNVFLFSRRIFVVTVEAPNKRAALHGKRRYRWTIRRHLCHLYHRPLHPLSLSIHQEQVHWIKAVFYHHPRLRHFLPATLRTPMPRWSHRQCHRRCTRCRSHEYPPLSRRTITRGCCRNRRYPPPRQKWKRSIGTKYPITRYFFFLSLMN